MMKPRNCGITEKSRQAFDRALASVAPDLIRPERAFIAAVAGMREGSLFAHGSFHDLEGAPYGTGALVVWHGSAWLRGIRATGRPQHSQWFRFTDAGRDLVLRAAREIEPNRIEGTR